MIVFVAGWSPEGRIEARRAGRALERLTGQLPFFAGEPVEVWRAPSGTTEVAWVAHRPHLIGGVRYVHAEAARVALFAGRPIRWEAGGRADGRGPLQASDFLQPPARWEERLDGRCALVRSDDARRELLVWTDPLGAYPVFRTQASGSTWFSNSAEALRCLHGGRDVDAGVLAGLLGGGWPLNGHPVWRAVRRVERGTVLRLCAGRPPRHDRQLPVDEIATLLGTGLDPAAAARDLVECLRALADWPGRPNVVLVTGGRDSRLVFAAALAAGFEFEAATAGAPGDPDVEIARELCRVVGIDHHLLPPQRRADAPVSSKLAAQLLALTAAGTRSLDDAHPNPIGLDPGPLPLEHTGQGGELTRAYYGTGSGGSDELVEYLYRRFVGRTPWRRELLSPRGRDLVRGQLRQWVEAQLAAGIDPVDMPDVFYLLRRMSTWGGPAHGVVEFARDLTSPLWSRRLIAHQLRLAREARASESFHLRVMRELAPELVSVRFADGFSWSQRSGRPVARAARTRKLVVEAVAESRRRVRLAPDPSDRFVQAHRLTRAAVAARPAHPAWEVLDRARVDSLLARPPTSLDAMRRYYVWRLATVFLPEELG